MAQRILVLAGSPRPQGNSDLLADAFIEGARQNGNVVDKVNVARYKIGGCVDCQYCFAHEGKCVQRDDMDEIYPLLDAADVLVFATPIYFYSFSSQLKRVIDRFYARALVGHKVSSCVLLATGADLAETGVFEPIVATYRAIAGYLKWKDLGIVTVAGVTAKGEALGTDGPRQARELGASIQ